MLCAFCFSTSNPISQMTCYRASREATLQRQLRQASLPSQCSFGPSDYLSVEANVPGTPVVSKRGVRLKCISWFSHCNSLAVPSRHVLSSADFHLGLEQRKLWSGWDAMGLCHVGCYAMRLSHAGCCAMRMCHAGCCAMLMRCGEGFRLTTGVGCDVCSPGHPAVRCAGVATGVC